MKKSSLKGLTTSNTAASLSASSSLSSRSRSVSSTTTPYYNDNIIIRKIENAIEGLSSDCFNYLAKRVLPGSETGKENTLTICDYIYTLKSEINPSNNYIKSTIILLCSLSTFFKNGKSFREITRSKDTLMKDY
jgi:hypothetical protein